MKKKSFIFLIFISYIYAFGNNMQNFIQQLKEQNTKTLQKYKTQINSIEEFINKNEETPNYNVSINLYRKYFKNDTYTINNLSKVNNPKYLFKRQTVLFYLFTTNMPKEAYLNVFRQAELIKNQLPVIGVLRGMNLKTKEILDNAFRGTYVHMQGRVNPFIFRDLGIKKAPVFIVANCQVKPYLRYRSCKFLYRFDGDVSLAYALTQIGDYNEKIKNISMAFYK